MSLRSNSDERESNGESFPDGEFVEASGDLCLWADIARTYVDLIGGVCGEFTRGTGRGSSHMAVEGVVVSVVDSEVEAALELAVVTSSMFSSIEFASELEREELDSSPSHSESAGRVLATAEPLVSEDVATVHRLSVEGAAPTSKSPIAPDKPGDSVRASSRRAVEPTIRLFSLRKGASVSVWAALDEVRSESDRVSSRSGVVDFFGSFDAHKPSGDTHCDGAVDMAASFALQNDERNTHAK